MPNDILQLSDKFQVVIPKAARKTMGITNPKTQKMRVAKVTKKGIYLEKALDLDDFYKTCEGAFPRSANKQLRQMRDEEWS